MNAKMKLVALVGASMVLLATEAATAIRVDSVTQRWPWNNKVDIAYTIEGGQDLVSSNFCKIVFTTTIDGKTYTIDGTSVGASANEGSHKVTWTLPSGQKGANSTMTAAVYPADAPSGNDYMIVDLSTGAVSYEGLLATQEESNRRYNTASYKTDKMILRKVPAGGPYPTGDSTNYSSGDTANTAKKWTTDRDYYIGVYPVTQYQYRKLVGSNRSLKTTVVTGNEKDHRPEDNVSWYDLRRPAGYTDKFASTSSVPAVAANSGTFFQRLNYVTGRYFDLPTEVMFEIAERAGAETYYYWGNTTNSILEHVACMENTRTASQPNGITMAVGTFLPNAWGLYDMAGNVYEWCRDEAVNGNMADRADVFTPADSGSSTECNRSLHGGATWNHKAFSSSYTTFRASWRGTAAPTVNSSTYGFRVAHIVE